MSIDAGNIGDLAGFRSVRQSNSRVFQGRWLFVLNRRSCSLIPAIVGFFSLALTLVTTSDLRMDAPEQCAVAL